MEGKGRYPRIGWGYVDDANKRAPCTRWSEATFAAEGDEVHLVRFRQIGLEKVLFDLKGLRFLNAKPFLNHQLE